MQTLNPRSGPGMLTWSGRFVPAIASAEALIGPAARHAPSAIDMAVAMSRIPRFGGHGRRWWSALDHQLFVEKLARFESDDRWMRLAALGHDDHESITEDIPTHFKSDEMRKWQFGLDVRIKDAQFPLGWTEYAKYEQAVKVIDQRALLAEAELVGPPCTDAPGVMLRYFGAHAAEFDLSYLRDTLAKRPSLDELLAGRDAPTVREYLDLMHELR